MRTSRYLLATLKETPADAELISHRLMLRAGMIRKLAAGLYTWLPTGFKVLKKVEGIVRQEMDAIGAQELLMPAVQPGELWQSSGRWEQYGPELLRFCDRHQRNFCFGPTHEEVITHMVRDELRSYKQTPTCYYQIQTKFRDEIRPRFGVMRAREFLMKDAYSFHLDQESLNETYQGMYQAYSKIFSRLGLDFRAVEADTGSIGGSKSHEFHVLASSGEDAIAFSDASDYAANVEMARSLAVPSQQDQPLQNQVRIETPGQKTVAQVCDFLNISSQQLLKTLIVAGIDDSPVALVLRGCDLLNERKAEKHALVASPFRLVGEAELEASIGCEAGFVGPVALNLPVIADQWAVKVNNFTCGANSNQYHLQGVNWQRDIPNHQVFDLRSVQQDELSPDGKGKLNIKRGIEVGHIFQLGAKYSEAMSATVLNQSGQAQTLLMGCYGIGISRIVAAAIEQNNDEKGIIWPGGIAPFQLALVPINMHRSDKVKAFCEQLYQNLQTSGIEVLFDDRNERPGVKFADMDLIGIPHRLVISERGLNEDLFEYKSRTDSEHRHIALEQLMDFVSSLFTEQANK